MSKSIVHSLVLFSTLLGSVAFFGASQKENSSSRLLLHSNSLTERLLSGEHSADDDTIMVQVKFEEFIIEIDDVYVWDGDKELEKIQQDTARVYLDLGEVIEGQTLRIKQLKKGKLKVFQRFENSITVMAEGPHCDLTEWKHYDSKWEELPVKGGKFTTISYSEKERELFADVSMNEITNAVKDQCGEDWAAQLQDVKSPTEYPCGVGHSRIFLRITLEKNSKIIERIISFEIPMGC